jgi:hypothetical protein
MKIPCSTQARDRRRFLQTTLTGAVAGFLTGAFELVVPSPLEAQSPLSPDAALNQLLEGNKRFTSGRLMAHEHDLAVLKQNTVEKQEPFAAVLSCADSRVPVELVFDQSIGHIFVTRVAGNVVTPEIIGSLEYGAAVLGTKALLRFGYGRGGTSCLGGHGTDCPAARFWQTWEYRARNQGVTVYSTPPPNLVFLSAWGFSNMDENGRAKS